MLLDAIEELDKEVFNGTQLNERKTAILLHFLLTNLELSLFSKNVKKNSPIILRNVYVNLKDAAVRNIFRFFSEQDSTELDILYINVPSIFGHKTENSFYVEVETHNREVHSYQRLLDFSDFCNAKGFNIFPILVTNRKKTEIHKNISVIEFKELESIAFEGIRRFLDIPKTPGLAYDDAAVCIYMLDLLSQKVKTNKNELLNMLENNPKFKRRIFDFHHLEQGIIEAEKLLRFEDDKNLRKRVTGNDGYIKKLKEHNYIEEVDNHRLRVTVKGSRLLLKWRGSIA